MDTHKFYLRLREAGINDRQAEAITEGLAGFLLGSVATKADLNAQSLELRAAIEQLRTETKAEFVAVRSEISAGYQRVLLSVSAVMAALISLATYVGIHFH